MEANMYQQLANRTNDGLCTDRMASKFDISTIPFNMIDFGGVINASLGLSGEVGELNDMLKKWIFHEKDICEDHLKKELGDVMWYVALMCTSFGWKLDDILEINIDKLKARYPEGFDIDKANHRKVGDV